jgi:hypothetical protein
MVIGWRMSPSPSYRYGMSFALVGGDLAENNVETGLGVILAFFLRNANERILAAAPAAAPPPLGPERWR